MVYKPNNKNREAKYAENQVVVHFKKSISRKQAEKLLSDQNVKFGNPLDFDTGLFYVVKFNHGTVTEWIEKFKKFSEVKSAEPNYIVATA